ncbi:hypothetical protein [Tritonibacter sp. SIMBA_163]|uniref:hypothetical protein n=1 Tax=Tritonibacter sp. SIMBA_163 TaxID=3080868 RepID=UPI00397EBA61
MRQHRQQEGAAKDPQVGELVELLPPNLDGGGLGADGVIDDALGQLQRQIEQRKQAGGDQQENQLVTLGVLPDELEKRAFYGKAPKILRLGTGPRGLTRKLT